MTEQGRANGSGGDRPRANYASASALVLAEANVWKTRTSTAQRYFTLVAFHAGPVPAYCLTVSGENAAARNWIGGKGGLLPHLRTFANFFFLSFSSFIPFAITERVNGFKGTSVVAFSLGDLFLSMNSDSSFCIEIEISVERKRNFSKFQRFSVTSHLNTGFVTLVSV